jgi:biopolymer transport protein ExbD
MDITNDMMLDALCLAAYSDTEDTRILLHQVLQIYQDTKKKNHDSVNLDLEVIFNIIDDIAKADVDLNRKSEVNRIILRIKQSPIAEKDPTFLTSVIEILNEDPANIKPSRIRGLTRKLQQWIVLTKSRQQAQQLLMKCSRYNPTDDVTNDVLINDVAEYARTLLAIQDNASGASETIDVVDMTNPNSIKKALKIYKEKRQSSVFKTGLKQLNLMLSNGGFLRGEFAAFAASSHNFKSGMLMKCARWFCTKSNIPVPQGLTPAVVMISLENEMPENTMDLLKEAYVDIYRQPIPEGISEDELVDRISEYYSQKNIKFIMYRFDENFGFSDFVKLMTGLKNRGMCVIATVIDYITLMRLEGDDKDNQPKRLQKLGQHFANYAKRNDMLILSGLQLNSAADELNASGKTNIVKQYNAFHLSDCKGLIKELDILIFMYIEENQDGVPFLTLAWRKHRGCKRPPKAHQYAAYRFHPIMGILEDEDTEYDFNRTDIYSDDLPSEEEATALFDGIRAQDKAAQVEEKAQEEELEPQDEYEFGV